VPSLRKRHPKWIIENDWPEAIVAPPYRCSYVGIGNLHPHSHQPQGAAAQARFSLSMHVTCGLAVAARTASAIFIIKPSSQWLGSDRRHKC
jgi:hypothetical protein